MMQYEHALLLLKAHNATKMTKDWLVLNFQQNFNKINTTINLIETSDFKIGTNLMPNRLPIINKNMHKYLNLSFEMFKIKCKNHIFAWQFLTKTYSVFLLFFFIII
jgi:hypothetical protein